MVRKVKRKWRSPSAGECVVLECDHLVVLNGLSVAMKYGIIQTIFCDECNKALLIPDTLEEINERYWRGKPATRF